MPAQGITPDDLREFKVDLTNEIKKLFRESNAQQTRKWLKSSEAREMLGISWSTLLNLRINGALQYSKIGGIIFYSAAHIHPLFFKFSNWHISTLTHYPLFFKFSNPQIFESSNFQILEFWNP